MPKGIMGNGGLWNRLFPSSLMPLFQSESQCETILMKMTLICMKMKLHAEPIFIWKVSHLDSLWNRGTRELGNGLFDWGFRCFSDIEANITNKSIYAFSFLVGKHRELQSINAKHFLPIIPIGIVAYALTLLRDNLCRNSCIALWCYPKSNVGVMRFA